MKTHEDYLPSTVAVIDMDIAALQENGDSDSVANYLYFLRDEVNKRIKAETKAKKAKKA